MIRLIATDLDGTLLRDDQTVSGRTRTALERARNAGITIVLVTARPILTARLIAREAGMGGLALVSNGAIVYDLERGAVVQHHPLEVSTARNLIVKLREAVPDVCFGFVMLEEFRAEAAYMLRAVRRDHGALMDQTRVGDALELLDQPVTKLIARSDRLEPDALLFKLESLGLDGFMVTHSNAPFVEIHAPEVNKAWALERLCVQLGVTRDQVVAFGDAPNDAPMLAWAGHGVAVANAHPRLLEIADEITHSNQSDGVALWLEAHV